MDETKSEWKVKEIEIRSSMWRRSQRAGGMIPMVALVLLTVGFLFPSIEARGAQSAVGEGVISGNVTADQGEVRAFRVRANDAEHQISYTVFTNKGQYHIYNLPPGTYEVQVREPGFESSTQTIKINGAETKTADLSLKARPPVVSNVKLLEYDQVYPPGPARAILENNCFGCHGYQEGGLSPYHLMPGRTEYEWATSVAKMFFAPGVYPYPASSSPGYNDPEWLTTDQKLLVIKYLAANFPPDHAKVDIKLDALVRDEDALAKAVYVQYELPPVDKSQSNATIRGTHDVMPSWELGLSESKQVYDASRHGTVWMAETSTSSILRVDTQNLDPKTRTREWTIHDSRDPSNATVNPNPITERNGHVYWGEERSDNIGDLDIATGEIHRYLAPTVSQGMHGIAVDSRGNVWTAGMMGTIARLDAETKKVTEWKPAPGEYYTLRVDNKDRVWAVSTARHILSMWDPKTEKWTTITPPNNIRRVVFDSKGMVWLCEYFANGVLMLNPDTQKFTEYKLPLKYGNPYEVSADPSDNIWLENAAYQSFVRLDRKTNRFTYFPYPEINSHTPKVEFDTDGIMWSELPAGQNRPRLTGFKPYGNVPMKNGNGMTTKNLAAGMKQ